MNIIKTLYRSCSRVSDMIDKVLKVILVLLVLGSALDLFLQVLYRFVLVHFVSFSMTWTNEQAQNFLVWMTYLAVGICYKENSMASVNFLYDRLKPRSKMVLYLLTRVVVFIFLFVGLRFGWESIQSVSNYHTASLHLPGYMVYGAPFLGCILMTYEAIVDVLGVICGELLPFVGRQVEEADGELTAEEQLAYEKFIHEHEAAAQSTGKGE